MPVSGCPFFEFAKFSILRIFQIFPLANTEKQDILEG